MMPPPSPRATAVRSACVCRRRLRGRNRRSGGCRSAQENCGHGRRRGDDRSADAPFGISWGEDGIVSSESGKSILRVSPQGGMPEILVCLNEGEEAHGPQILPGGQHVLFTLATGTASDRWDRAHIVVQSLSRTGGARRVDQNVACRSLEHRADAVSHTAHRRTPLRLPRERQRGREPAEAR